MFHLSLVAPLTLTLILLLVKSLAKIPGQNQHVVFRNNYNFLDTVI